jgi:Skp family chaperone for outer membrane proteins
MFHFQNHHHQQPIKPPRIRISYHGKRLTMTRGNQRELARERNAKKQNAKTKAHNGDGALATRKDRDAAIMQEKQRQAEAKKQQQQQQQQQKAQGGKK